MAVVVLIVVLLLLTHIIVPSSSSSQSSRSMTLLLPSSIIALKRGITDHDAYDEVKEVASAIAHDASAITNAPQTPDEDDGGNPLLRSWSDEPFGLPPFADIRPHHFPRAFDVAMESHLADLRSIAAAGAAAEGGDDGDFDSVLGAYDRAGYLYRKIHAVYNSYVSSMNGPEMRLVQTKMAPRLSRHASKTYDVPGLFDRIARLHGTIGADSSSTEGKEGGGWTTEQVRLLERVYIDFVRMGAKFDDATRVEYADIQGELPPPRSPPRFCRVFRSYYRKKCLSILVEASAFRIYPPVGWSSSFRCVFT